MTTYDDDFIRLQFPTRRATINLVDVGLEWPPPERLTEIGNLQIPNPMVRVSMSEITDEQRADMTHVCRGAEYRYERDVSP